MTSTRPRLVILKGTVPLEANQIQALKSVFDVVEVHSAEAARKMLDGSVGGIVICAPGEYLHIEGASLPTAASSILERIGDGIGVVDAHGSLMWTDASFKVHDEQVRSAFVQRCREALEQFNNPQEKSSPNRRRSRRFAFGVDDSQYELVITPASLDQSQDHVTSVVGGLRDITAAAPAQDRTTQAQNRSAQEQNRSAQEQDRSAQSQQRLQAIEAAGAGLLNFDPAVISKMNMAERLKHIEQKIVRAIHDVLGFRNFEMRLLDRETGQLELVIAENIAPLKVGEVLYARAEDNGISGYVAATGRSYNCPNVQEDPLYREGMENAGSSLTVPLLLHDRVIGTLNFESGQTNAFSESDRAAAEALARYIAMAMNILDLLVVERFTTNQQVAANVVSELSIPLAEVARQATALRSAPGTDESIRQIADQLLTNVSKLNSRLQACTAGPRTILGAEQELHRHQPDPLLVGKRILVADDEPAIRETLSAILAQKGATVTMCKSGSETIEAIKQAGATPGEFFDLIISDIKMPDRNGYEVYRTAKAINANVPVVLMTGFGYDPHHCIVRASQEGLQSFLFKPFKVNQLMDVITRSLAKR